MTSIFTACADSLEPDEALWRLAQSGFPLKEEARGHMGGYCGVLYSCEAEIPVIKSFLKQNDPGPFDIFVTNSVPDLGKPGLLILDMDMTCVQIEGIDEIARRCGVYDEVAVITAAAMRGELDFARALRKRVALLKGCPATVLEEIRASMPETGGLGSLLRLTAEHGWIRGICSGGFTQLISVIERKYALQIVCANSLAIANGALTGDLDRDVVDGAVKRRTVIKGMAGYGIPREQCLVIGDGANDLGMIGEAGFGLAYHAKPLVRQNAPYMLNYCDLSAVALLLKLWKGR